MVESHENWQGRVGRSAISCDALRDGDGARLGPEVARRNSQGGREGGVSNTRREDTHD